MHLKQSNICLPFNTPLIGLSLFLNERIYHESLLFEQSCYLKTIFREFKMQNFLSVFLLVQCNNKEATIHFFYQQEYKE